MKTSNKLSYSKNHFFTENETQYKITAKVSLDDDCKNGMYDFSVTADIYEQRKNGRFVWFALLSVAQVWDIMSANGNILNLGTFIGLYELKSAQIRGSPM